MSNLIRYGFAFAVALAVIASTVFAAEVRNLRNGQDGKRAFVQYYLAGMPGEKEADVTVAVEVGGKKYKAERLTLTGDFGRGVKIGIGRKVYWDLLKDMPAGFDGEIGWDVDAASTEGFIAAVKAEEERKTKEELAEKRRITLQMAEEERLAKDRAEQLRLAAEKAEIAEERVRQAKEAEEKARQQAAMAQRQQATPKKQLPGRPVVADDVEFEKDGLRFYRKVVLDTRTGLIWARNGNIAGKEMNWNTAMIWVKKPELRRLQ